MTSTGHEHFIVDFIHLGKKLHKEFILSIFKSLHKIQSYHLPDNKNCFGWKCNHLKNWNLSMLTLYVDWVNANSFLEIVNRKRAYSRNKFCTTVVTIVATCLAMNALSIYTRHIGGALRKKLKFLLREWKREWLN